MSLNRSKLLRWLASPRLLFYVLPWLILLLIIGTVAQREIGLYDAERLYFASWWVWAGPIPVPGVYPTLALMSLSLLAKLILKSVWKPVFIGTLLTHGGALVLLVGGLVTALTAEEGYIPLKEGASASRITDYHERRFAVYRDNAEIVSIPHHSLSQGETLTDSRLPFTITITEYFRHALAKPREDENANYQGIAQQVTLEAGELMKKDEANHTGVVFDVAFDTLTIEDNTKSDGETRSADRTSHEPAKRRLTARAAGAQEPIKKAEGRHLLFEPMPRYPSFIIDGTTYEIRLGKIQRSLPFSLTLNDFEKISYPGTMQAREYQSDITLNDGEVNWRGLIAMNEPLRYKGYTFYQSSFLETEQGPISVLAVVKNDGLMFPYIASALMSLGLIWHIALKMRRGKHA